MKILQCQVQHINNPLGYRISTPVFRWKVTEAKGQATEAARIRIFQGDVCVKDTGWAQLDSLAAPVELELAPRTRYTWRVWVRTDAKEEGESPEQFFETGKIQEPWMGKWISCDNTESRHPIFIKQIHVRKPLASARLYLSGLGLYQAYLDGEKIGQELLTPYCNDYNTWVQIQTYDVTGLLGKTDDSHLLAVVLGNGWYKGRFGFWHEPSPYFGDEWKLIGELHLVYQDGSEEVIGTDTDWQVERSNIIFSNIYDGEVRDDTLPVLPAKTAVLTPPPRGELTDRYSVPVVIQQEMVVQEILHTPAGETVLDLGQNITGIFRLHVDLPRGSRIRLQFGEILQQGNFYRDNLRTAKAEYVYISDGEPKWICPSFTFYGYRYVKIEGISQIRRKDFVGLVLHSEIPRTGYLKTGNPLVNRLIENAEWGQRGNFLDIPMDCPQRDERMGWTGDAQVFAPTACFQRDCYAFFRKYLFDMGKEQQARGGLVPEVIPSVGDDHTSSAWCDATCIIPMVLYDWYGDLEILREHYPAMCAWVRYMKEIDGRDHGWRRSHHYGDWLALDQGLSGEDPRKGGTDPGLIADTYYRYSVQLTARAAGILGRWEEAAGYEALAEEILQGIRKDYFTETGALKFQTQTAYLLALYHGLSEDQVWMQKGLVGALREANGELRTGFVGTPLLCQELTRAGRADLAYDLLLNEAYPGWLYAVKLGATTIWERWNSVLPDGTISSTGMNSLNHYAYGSVVAWIYGFAAGLRQETGNAGFRRVVIQPCFDIRLEYLELVFCSAAGDWKVHWEIREKEVCLGILVPYDCEARLILPGKEQVLRPGEYTFLCPLQRGKSPDL